MLLKIYLEKYHIVENLTFSKDFYRKTSPTIQISMAKLNIGRDYKRKTSCSWKILRQSSIRNHFFDEATCCWYYLPENFILLNIFKFSFNLSQHSITVRPFVCVYAIRFTIKCYKIMLLSSCTSVANSPLLLLLPLFYVVCYVTLSKKNMSNYCETPAKVSYEQQKEELMRPRNVPLRVAPSAEFYVKCLLQQKP